MLTTTGTYSWSFVTHTFHNGQPSHSDKGYQYQTWNGFREIDSKLETQKRIRYAKPHPALDRISH